MDRNIHPGGIQGAFTEAANQPDEWRMMGIEAAAQAAVERARKPSSATAWPTRPDVRRKVVRGAGCGSVFACTFQDPQQSFQCQKQLNGWDSRYAGFCASPPVTGKGAAAIHLGVPLPAPSSGLPGHSGGQPSNVSCLALLRVGFT
ncbi:hypothetical protein ARTHROSP310_02110 [Arthrobacter sp. AD-310]